MLVAPVPGKQVGEVSFMAGQADKDILKPCPGFYAGRLARGEQRVDDGGADGCVVVAGEEIVLAAKGQRPDGVLEVKSLHQDLLAEQKLGLEKYKLELNEAFAQYKGKLKEVVLGHGVWLSERAWVIAIVTIEALIAIFVIAAYNYAKAKFT